jgi:ABC-2 type transport system ATP-binding protein
VIEVKNLNKSYGGIQAIQNLNFSIQKGEVVGFLGPNGAGKSTTMKIITGFMAPTSGEARVAGFDVFESPLEVKKRIGYLPETPPVYLDMGVEEYLQYVADLKGVPAEKKKFAVEKSLEKTNLISVRHRLIGNLSKGFRQRVGIAQALLSDPEVLILDEPTVGLDPKQVAEIRDLINELKGQHTIVLSTHILSEVQAMCQRIIIINKGQIVTQDSLAHLTAGNVGRTRVQLRLRKNLEQFAAALAQMDPSLKCQKEDQGIFSVEGPESEDLVEKLALFAIQNKFGLSEIAVQKLDLEDVFLKLTYGEGKE